MDTAPARGTVTLDGKPLSAGSVVLLPKKGRSSSGSLNPDGTFVLGTYKQGDGAIVGPNKIIVYPLKIEAEAKTPPPGYVPVPTRYQSASTSGFEVEIKAGQTNEINLELATSSSS